ncbi:MAG: DUF1837 domain-containing protein [Bacteriovoracaceae bacterium]|nr:DUF1837 domain-containing protein [Bacteriovoracaceae bacterium]
MSVQIEDFGSKKFFFTSIDEKELLGISPGYEGGSFRDKGLAELMFNALPDFALDYKELKNLSTSNVMERLRKAVKTIYSTGKFKSRGEFGELLLHVVMRDFYGSVPAISKIYYKTSANETVKGFDAVHVVPQGEDLNLWVGETKFYSSISNAISDVVEELRAHVKPDYLRSEFILINGKIEESWPFSGKLKSLIDSKTSLDEVFNKLVIPVLLTYDSDATKNNTVLNEKFKQEIKEEIKKYGDNFRSKDLPKNIEIVLILVPLHTKKNLAEVLHAKLEHLQKGL